MERAITFLEKRELPPHWDRDILNSHEEESTNNSTTASSESEELEDDDEEDESPEVCNFLFLFSLDLGRKLSSCFEISFISLARWVFVSFCNVGRNA